MSDSQFRHIQQVLHDVLAEGPLGDALDRHEVLARWPEIVGEDIARHAQAVGIEDGVLLVRTDGSVWAQELSLLQPQIQQSLNRQLGAHGVRQIRFITGSASWNKRFG